MPREIAFVYADAVGLRMVPLVDRWAERQFVVCFRDEDSLPMASRLLMTYLTSSARPQELEGSDRSAT